MIEGKPSGARSGQEQSVPVWARYQRTVHTVLHRPRPGAFFPQLVLLFFGRHAPHGTPVDIGGIILWVQFGFVIDKAVIAIIAVGAVLRHRVIAAVAPLVCAPVGEEVLRHSFAPGEVVAVVLGGVGSQVAGRPQCAAGKPQVNPLVVIGRRHGLIRPGTSQQVIDQACHIRNVDCSIKVCISTRILLCIDRE